MSEQEKKEQEIMNQEMSQDEMETVAGGHHSQWEEECYDGEAAANPHYSEDHTHCYAGQHQSCDNKTSQKYGRPLRNPDGSMNCSATVEDGSWCGSNDACYDDESVYFGMKHCAKAWK